MRTAAYFYIPDADDCRTCGEPICDELANACLTRPGFCGCGGERCRKCCDCDPCKRAAEEVRP